MSEQALDNNADLIWSVAEILRGDFKRSEYQKVVLPLTVLRRLDAVLNSKKAEFLARVEALGRRLANEELEFAVGPYRFMPQSQSIELDGEPCELTAKDFEGPVGGFGWTGVRLLQDGVTVEANVRFLRQGVVSGSRSSWTRSV